MLIALLLACAPADTGETAYVYTGPSWRPIIDGFVDGDPSCRSADKGPCYDCVETSTNWYVRWTLDELATGDDRWWVLDMGNVKTVTAGDGSCVALTLGAPIPE